jgi:excisionase family DNA binding protein
MSPGPGPYQLGTIASILKVSRPVVMKLIRDGELNAQPSPSGLRVDLETLKSWVEAQCVLAQREAGGLAKFGGNA